MRFGLNTHCPSKKQKIWIRGNQVLLQKKNGYWITYPFYQGYDKKYKNKWDAFKDTFLNPVRWEK